MRKQNLFLHFVLSLVLSSVSVCAQTRDDAPGLSILGKGYDVFGKYANQESVKPYLLFQWSNKKDCGLEDYLCPDFVYLKTINAKYQHTVSGMSGRDFSETFAAKAGLKADAAYFKAAMKASYETTSRTNVQKFYTSYMDINPMWVIELDTRKNDRGQLEIISMLDNRFKEDLHQLEPSELFEYYGTHFIAAAVIGARAEFTSESTISQKWSTEKIEAAVEAKYKAIKMSAELETENEEILKESKTTTNLQVFGGNAPALGNKDDKEMYKLWADGIKTDPVLIDFDEGKDSLVPIWELTENKSRRKELEDAFIKLRDKHPLPAKIEPPKPIQLSGTYMIQQAGNGRFLDAYSGKYKKYPYSAVTRSGGAGPQWILKPVGEKKDTYTIQQRDSLRFLDAHTSAKYDYRAVTRSGGADSWGRQWILKPVGEKKDTYTIQQRDSLRFLDSYWKSPYLVVTRLEGDVGSRKERHHWILKLVSGPAGPVPAP